MAFHDVRFPTRVARGSRGGPERRTEIVVLGSGWIAWVQDEDAMYRFDGADWTLAGIEGPQGPEGPAYQPDVAVDAIAGRAIYDDEAAAFSVLVVSDSGNAGQPTLYFKLSAGSADWSAGITWLPETAGPAFTARAATTSDIVIASALNSGDVIDGVTLASGDLVLVKDQASPEQNGIYVVGVSPARVFGLSAYDQHPGALVTVQEGTLNVRTVWQCTSNRGGTLDTDPIVFAQLVQAASESNPGLVELATPAEVLSGTDTQRAVTPAGLAGAMSLGTNGYVQLPGGLILQWGYSGSDGPVVYPLTFPTAVYSVTVSARLADRLSVPVSVTASGFTIATTIASSGSASGVGGYWMAIGS